MPQEGGFTGDWKLISQAVHEIILLNYHRRARLCGAHSSSRVEERQEHLLPGPQPKLDLCVSLAAPESGIFSGSCVSAQEERRGLPRERDGLEEVATADEGRARPDGAELPWN